jgi:hypothetical protein
MFPAVQRTRMLGDFASDIASDPSGFGGAWGQVQAQLNAEGANSTVVTAAKNAFASSFDSLSPTLNSIGSPQQLLSSCTQYALLGTTIGGAVDMVGGLIAAEQTGTAAQAPQLVESFTGTMIGLAVASGAATAGVGAAIVGAVTVLMTIMQSAGLFSTGPTGTSIPGCATNSKGQTVTYSSPPDWSLGPPVCAGFNGSRNAPGTFSWRNFPNPGDPVDQYWFIVPGGSNTGSPDGQSIAGNTILWKGLRVTGPILASNGGPALMDLVFPNFSSIGVVFIQNPFGAGENTAFSQLPNQVQDFHRSFFAAWKLNQEYILNGLTPQPDWAVLYHTINLWNRAHAATSTYTLKDGGATPLWEANSLMPSLASNVGTTDPIWDPASGGHGFILNTGPKLSFTLGSAFAPSSSSVGKTLAYGAGGLALGSLALAAYQARQRRTTIARIYKGWASDASDRVRKLVKR